MLICTGSTEFYELGELACKCHFIRALSMKEITFYYTFFVKKPKEFQFKRKNLAGDFDSLRSWL